MTNFDEAPTERQKAYAEFADFRTYDRDNYTAQPNTAEWRTLQMLGAQCWQRRDELLSDNALTRRNARKDIASQAHQFLREQKEQPVQRYKGPQDPGSLIAEHLADIATMKAGGKQYLDAVHIASNRLNTRAEVLRVVGRQDILDIFHASELAFSAVISEIVPKPPIGPQPLL